MDQLPPLAPFQVLVVWADADEAKTLATARDRRRRPSGVERARIIFCPLSFLPVAFEMARRLKTRRMVLLSNAARP
jgi:hypothetical protein